MDSLKVCFTGVGSIAKRHIRNLRDICTDRGIDIIIDAYRREKEQAEGIDHVYVNMEEIKSDYDVVFITNPTECHLGTLYAFENKAKHFFIEKPVVSIGQIIEAKEFKTRKGTLYYVACPLRYHAVIKWIKDNIALDDVLAVRSISSSYLPDWRPDQDYRKVYCANRDMGGGVSIDLIHEWDYITYLFGWPKKMFSMIGKKSNLEINSDDYALYIAEYDRMTVELHLDYYGRKTIRQIELFTKDETIVGDLVESTVTRLVSGEEIKFDQNRDNYQKKELFNFLDMIDGYDTEEEKNMCGFEHGLRVLELTQGWMSFMEQGQEKHHPYEYNEGRL